MPFSSPVRVTRTLRVFLATAVGISVLAGSSLVASPPAAAAACPTAFAPTGNAISTPANLQWLRDNDSAWSGSWTQTANIDMGGCEWTSAIGRSFFDSPFTGTYDGGGFVISGLTIRNTGLANVGLFGYAGRGSIIRNIGFTGDVEGAANVGGLIGQLENGRIESAFATGTVTGTFGQVGGLVGVALTTTGGGAEVLDSFATGTVIDPSSFPGIVGGLIGRAEVNSFDPDVVRVSQSYAIGRVTGVTDVGGLVGFSSGTNVVNSFWDLNTSGVSRGVVGTGKTTSQMLDIATYAPWDIAEGSTASNTWGICPDINGGYPFLTAFYPTGTCDELRPLYTPQPQLVDFTYLLPDGRECTSFSPQRVQVGTMRVLPGEDAPCRTSDGSLVAGWVIPVPQGFTGYGSVHEPFPPGLPVRVTDSQRFTLVPYDQTLQVDYDANIATDDACSPANVLHGSQDGRVEFVWVPRADFSMARTPSRAPCQPEGYELVGWNTSGDGSGEVIGLGEPLPEDWATHRTNHHTLYAMWQGA